MFNTTNMKLGSNSTEVFLNTPATGMMQKSNPKSRFIRFQKGSQMEDYVFPRNGDLPCLMARNKYDNLQKLGDITVLQVLVFGDNQYLCEIIFDKDITDISS